MVPSASSSNTKCPSGFCTARRATLAVRMALSSAVGSASLSAIKIVRAPVFSMSSIRLLRGHCKIGGVKSRPDSALDGGRKAGRGEIACEQEIVPHGLRWRPLFLLAWKGGEGRAPLFDD